MKRRPKRAPVAVGRKCIRDAGRDNGLCYGRATSGALWGRDETPTRTETCPRCWGIYKGGVR